MKNIIVLIAALALVTSCNKNPSNEKVDQNQNNTAVSEKNDIIGKNGREAVVKRIYQKAGKTFVVLDPVEVKYSSPEGNGNLQIDVDNKFEEEIEFKLSNSTEILDESCKEITVEELLAQKDHLIKLQKVGFSGDGSTMLHLNIGCWQ